MYSFHIANFLSYHEALIHYTPYVYCLNPKMTANYRKTFVNLNKTDDFDMLSLKNVETVKKREALRGKVGYIGFTPEALYADFMKVTPKIGFWLDTSEQSPEKSVEDILLHFKGQ